MSGVDGAHGEELLPCPFVPTHFVRPGTRFQRHLERCRRECLKAPNCPFYQAAKEKVVCSFDSTHYIWPQDLNDHLSKCDGAIMAMKYMSIGGPSASASTSTTGNSTSPEVAPIRGSGLPEDEIYDDDGDEEEDWDRDTRIAQARGIKIEPYNPMAKVQQGGADAYLLVPQGKSRSERIAYRRDIRLGGGVGSDSASSTSTATSTQASNSPSHFPSRPPNVTPRPSNTGVLLQPDDCEEESHRTDSVVESAHMSKPDDRGWQEVPIRGRGRASSRGHSASIPRGRGRGQRGQRGRGGQGF